MGKKHEVVDPYFVWAGLRDDSKRVHALVRSQVFNPIDHRHVYFWSAVTETLIHTRNLIGHADDKWECDLIWFNETRDGDTVKELIIRYRDAFCHSSLYKVATHGRSSSWIKNIMVGKQSIGRPARGDVLTCEFEDDALILVGKDSLYLKRHIFRAFLELDEIRASKDPRRDILERSTQPRP